MKNIHSSSFIVHWFKKLKNEFFTPSSFSIFHSPFIISSLLLCASCVNNINEVRAYDKPNLPDETFKDARMVRSVEGNVELEIKAPLIYNYENVNPRVEYPKGIFAKFFNKDKTVKATLSANYAIDNTASKMMEARNNVVIINYKSGDTIYAESLIWNKTTRKIFSNKVIKCVNVNTTYGEGFDATETLDSIVIRKITSTVLYNDDDEAL